MGYPFNNSEQLQEKISSHMSSFHVFDLPKGRHIMIIDEFYALQRKAENDPFEDKLIFVNNNLNAFNEFLDGQGKYKSHRLDAERQAEKEPERMKNAIQTLKKLGFNSKIVSNNELNFTYRDANIKYFPYSGWATGKTIKDGRGLNNLVKQLTVEEDAQEQHSFQFQRIIDGVTYEFTIIQGANKFTVQNESMLIADISHDETTWRQISGEPLNAELIESIGDYIEEHFC